MTSEEIAASYAEAEQETNDDPEFGDVEFGDPGYDDCDTGDTDGDTGDCHDDDDADVPTTAEPPEVVAASLFAPNARAGFGRLFRACMEQPQCWRRRPGIAQTFTNRVRRLEAHPVTTWVEPPRGGSPVKVVLDGGRLANWLIDESENTPDYRNVPAMIAELADRDPRPIATEVAASLAGSGTGILGYGLALGVGCGEWIRQVGRSITGTGTKPIFSGIRVSSTSWAAG